MFFIYKDFELQGVLTSFTQMKWLRSYNSVGNFEVELLFDKEIFKLLDIGNYIYKKDTKEACVILERYVRTNSTGEILLTVKGESLSCFLNNRIFSYTG
ncbi:MAG: siphovirus ReqiPepy6 Gp37-like family protein, partial [Eubacteriales bacterium]|nr:siphovirus ReqiPepy6 Gp37-like family protein [Eubacteriales bacterium]